MEVQVVGKVVVEMTWSCDRTVSAVWDSQKGEVADAG